jgi:hypothetical protein
MFLRNECWFSTDYTALYPRRWYSWNWYIFLNNVLNHRRNRIEKKFHFFKKLKSLWHDIHLVFEDLRFLKMSMKMCCDYDVFPLDGEKYETTNGLIKGNPIWPGQHTQPFNWNHRSVKGKLSSTLQPSPVVSTNISEELAASLFNVRICLVVHSSTMKKDIYSSSETLKHLSKYTSWVPGDRYHGAAARASNLIRSCDISHEDTFRTYSKEAIQNDSKLLSGFSWTIN